MWDYVGLTGMASLRKYARSPYWTLRQRDLDSGKWVESSTGLLVKDPAATRMAQRMAEAATIKEKQIGDGKQQSPAFVAWAPSYIKTHFRAQGSRSRYNIAWQAIKVFLAEMNILFPRQIKYGHAQRYMDWRMETPVHGRDVKHNTALAEVHFLSQLMNEAIRREFTESNPIARLGIGRAPQKVKPELTDADIAKLRAALAKGPEWQRNAFEIALYTGCRFSETAIQISLVDFDQNTIRIEDAKRDDTDPKKFFTVPMDARLRPVLEKLRDAGAVTACNLTDEKNWRMNEVFRKAGVAATFHSLRVTFITRCHRAGLSQTEAMRLVNHSSQLIHRIYSRLGVDDVREARSRVLLP